MWRLYIVFIFLFLLDLYIFKGFSLLIQKWHPTLQFWFKILYWFINIAIVFNIIYVFSNIYVIRAEKPIYFRMISGIFVTILMTKIGFLFFHLLDDAFWATQNIGNYFVAKIQQTEPKTITRGKFLTQMGVGVAAVLFSSFTYGVLKGRYAFQVMKEKIVFKNLPKAFDGLKIVQISDLHLGSFINDFDDVAKGIALINAQEADYVFFTGDMVNVHASEAEAWVELFATIKAKQGKYSIFGNHDYCDYGKFTPQEKQESIQKLKAIHHAMGFKLLEDENLYLEKDGEKIALIGMHNWGKDFHQVGDLNKSLEGLKNDDFKILLSHDPSLWEKEILSKKQIELTLSGHTHGMQMGVEIPYFNLKWSPAKLRYKRWAGLYNDQQSYLYINRGFGFLGFPGRVGIKPEITVIELYAEKA